MFGRAKAVKVTTEVSIRPAPTPRDSMKRGRDNQKVSAGPLPVKRACRARRAVPIRAYVGPNGHGKSLAAVNDLLPSLAAGRKVLSTVPLLDWTAQPPAQEGWILDPVDGKFYRPLSAGADDESEGFEIWDRPLHPNYRRLTEWQQIMEFEEGDVFLDEVAGVASSRSHSGMPAAVERLFQKLRKADITLSWTAPAWARADLIIRETTQAVTVCEGYRPKAHEDAGKLWRRNQLFEWSTYDAAVYTDWTEGKREKAKRLAFQRFHGPGSEAFLAYDSLGAVDTIISVTDSGRCVSCGGTRSAPKCSCEDYLHRMEEASERRERAVAKLGPESPEEAPAPKAARPRSGRSQPVAFSPRGHS